jgi:hypothetical protein
MNGAKLQLAIGGRSLGRTPRELQDSHGSLEPDRRDAAAAVAFLVAPGDSTQGKRRDITAKQARPDRALLAKLPVRPCSNTSEDSSAC